MIRRGNRLQLLESGADYFPQLLAALACAREAIWMETYIFRADAIGLAVTDALCAAARRGVAVHLLLDGFGARDLPAEHLTRLREAGAHPRFYRPFRNRPWQWMQRHGLRRMHRKVAIIDQCVGFVGGINIIDDYDAGRLQAPRLDYAARIEGPLLADLLRDTQRLWRLAGLAQGQFDAIPHWRARPAPPPSAGRQRAAFIPRDNLRHRRAIETAYLRAIRSARHEILIANAYFLPGIRFRHALIQAAQRGVSVTLLTQGYTDHPLYLAATRALYAHFMRHDIHIHEYHASELHAKAAVIDGRWATVGSSNIDPFSLLLAREANVVIHDRAFAESLRQSLMRALAQGARRIHPLHWQRAAWPRRALIWLAYGLVRGLMGIAGLARGWDNPRAKRMRTH